MSEVSGLVWAITIVVIVGLLAFDFIFHVRKAHVPTLKEAAVWSAIYVGLAIVFGIVIWFFGPQLGDPNMGPEYFSGYILEKALSVDNLFVFLIIISSFKVPREDQQKVLLFGIVFALIARSGFIFAGKALIDAFQWMFYIFGAFLIWTAIHMLMPEDPDKDEADNFMIRMIKKVLHTTDHYDGDKLFTIENGKRALTPMLLVMVAIGATDILFAFDSIPAIYGVTTNVYLVFSATAFSLMGLRQLYFLIDGLLDRLIYLKFGLTAILFFIGAKLIIHALHENEVSFINGGEPWHGIPEIGPYTSLVVIIAILAITIIASFTSPKGQAMAVASKLDRVAGAYLHDEIQQTPEAREKDYQRIVRLEQKLAQLDPKHVEEVKNDGHDDAVERAHKMHAAEAAVAPAPSASAADADSPGNYAAGE